MGQAETMSAAVNSPAQPTRSEANAEEYVKVPRKEFERWIRELEEMRRLLRSSDSESRR
jgi:hypothetical protein